MDELRHRESENLPEEFVQESVQEQEKEHSQYVRSEARIPIHQRVWEDLHANEFSFGYKWVNQVSKFVRKLERHEHSRERETDGANHGKFKSIPQIPILEEQFH